MFCKGARGIAVLKKEGAVMGIESEPRCCGLFCVGDGRHRATTQYSATTLDCATGGARDSVRGSHQGRLTTIARVSPDPNPSVFPSLMNPPFVHFTRSHQLSCSIHKHPSPAHIHTTPAHSPLSLRPRQPPSCHASSSSPTLPQDRPPVCRRE